MRKTLPLLLLAALGTGTPATATTGVPARTSTDINVSQPAELANTTKDTDSIVYTVVEQVPVYPGGEAALLRDVSSNLKFPPEAAKQELQGTVVLRFVIKVDGTIGKIQVMRGLSKECDQAAFDVVRKLKRFTPGKTNGRPVAAWFMLPIRFVLQ